MTDTLTPTELVEASRRVLDAELPAPTGLETQPLIERRKNLQPHLEALGWFDVLSDAEKGGLGLPPSFAARLIRLAGAYLAPGPLVEQVLTVPWLLTNPSVRSGILSESSGLAIVTVDPCRDVADKGGRSHIQLVGGKLRGRALCVLGAVDADAMLVHVMEDGAERLVMLPTSQPGLEVQVLRSSDPCQSVGNVVFDCDISDEQVIGSEDESLPIKLRAWTRLGAGEYLTGITERVLTFGANYAREREQFGRKIGSFQAVQHLLADLAVASRSLANLMDLASTELSSVAGDDERVMIAVTAKARASTEAVVACEAVLQVLGGIGYTVEHPLHHYFKRALSLAAQFGSPTELHVLAGRLLLAQNGRGERSSIKEVS